MNLRLLIASVGALLLGCEGTVPPPTVVVGPAAAAGVESDGDGDAGPRPRHAGDAGRPAAPYVEQCCNPGDPICYGDLLCPPGR
jgi:hypothetical protein